MEGLLCSGGWAALFPGAKGTKVQRGRERARFLEPKKTLVCVLFLRKFLFLLLDVDGFKVFIEFVTALLLFDVFWFFGMGGMWNLSTPTRG